MQWFYTVFNLVIFSGPVLGCYIWFRKAWQYRVRMLAGYLCVSVPWVLIDAASVDRGWWNYNPDFIFGPRVLGLPLEEIAFFFTVPLACMITLYALASRVRGVIAKSHGRIVLGIVAGLIIAFACVHVNRERTIIDAILALITIGLLYRSTLITGRAFWAWNIVIVGLFLIFNTMLTALPVVLYDVQYMSGIRIGTIPIEDMLYNFSLLNLMALVVRPDRVAKHQ